MAPLAALSAGEEQCAVTLAGGKVLMVDFRSLPEQDDEPRLPKMNRSVQGPPMAMLAASAATSAAPPQDQRHTTTRAWAAQASAPKAATPRRPHRPPQSSGWWCRRASRASTLAVWTVVGDPHAYLVTSSGETFCWGVRVCVVGLA